MILWIALFLLVLAISFVLAVQSMKDYQEIPSQTGEEYGVFLIRKPVFFTHDILTKLHQDCLDSGLVISFERLVKGAKSALVVYGPKRLLGSHTNTLDLLELEDYVFQTSPGDISAWEVGMKVAGQTSAEDVKNYFKKFPPLSEGEQFWWQLVLAPEKSVSDKKSFQAQIRAVLLSPDQIKRTNLAQTLQNLVPEKLIKLPKAFSDAQIIDFYQKRSLRKDGKNPLLESKEILQLLVF